RLRDAAQDLEKRALSGAIAANDTNNLSLLDLEAHILERPELLYLVALNDLAPAEHVERLPRKVAGLAPYDVAQRRLVPPPFASSVAEQVALRQIFNGYDGIRHGSDQIRKTLLHRSKSTDAEPQKKGRHADAHGQTWRIKSALPAQDAPAEPINDSHHR